MTMLNRAPRMPGRMEWLRARAGRVARVPVRRGYRRGASWPRPWAALTTALVLAVLVVAAVMVARARATECRTAPAKLIVATQVTAEEGYDPAPPPGLVSRAVHLASCSGGTLLMLRAAGQGGQASAPVTLRVYREPGQLENDPVVRAKAIRALISRTFQRALLTPVHGNGRDLIGLLAAISQ